jgi:hypothetical protein
VQDSKQKHDKEVERNRETLTCYEFLSKLRLNVYFKKYFWKQVEAQEAHYMSILKGLDNEEGRVRQAQGALFIIDAMKSVFENSERQYKALMTEGEKHEQRRSKGRRKKSNRTGHGPEEYRQSK